MSVSTAVALLMGLTAGFDLLLFGATDECPVYGLLVSLRRALMSFWRIGLLGYRPISVREKLRNESESSKMEGQLFVDELAILLLGDIAQNLLGSTPFPSGADRGEAQGG